MATLKQGAPGSSNRRQSEGELMQSYEAPPSQSSAMEIATTRAAQEVQAAMIMAKKFPRDEFAARARISQACKRPKLAEESAYSYPRGGETVTGPSIRLAEVLAQAWGNMEFGITELDQSGGASQVMAFAWDLETNTRQTKTFAVPHMRFTKNGSKALSDPRDVYEMVANQGARRLRACILGVIPGDVVDDALAECEKTLKGSTKEPLSDRIKKMVNAFADHGVTADMIAARLGHKLDVTSETELVGLRKIYNSIKDGMTAASECFGSTTTKTETPQPPSFEKRIADAGTTEALDLIVLDAGKAWEAGTIDGTGFDDIKTKCEAKNLTL